MKPEKHKNSIMVTLSLNPNGTVHCHLQTNDLPFTIVRTQLRRFVESLQWQLDDERRCPFYEPTITLNEGEIMSEEKEEEVAVVKPEAGPNWMQEKSVIDLTDAGFRERITPKDPGENVLFFNCTKCEGIHYRHAGYINVMAPFIRPNKEYRMDVQPYAVSVCVSCKSCYIWVNEQMYEVTDKVDLEAWEKMERELHRATGPGGQC